MSAATLMAVNSGANINDDSLRHVAERVTAYAHGLQG